MYVIAMQRKGRMMLRLTNANREKGLFGTPLLIAVKHVVSIRPVGERTGILTVTGVDYLVSQTMDEIGKMDAWNAIH